MLSQNEKKEIAHRLHNLYCNNYGYYRNDTGNGSAGAAYLTIDNNHDCADQLRELISSDDARIVDHDEIVSVDYNDHTITARQLIQDAIKTHNDLAQVDDDDIIVRIETNNGWVGYYWLYII